ncbi:hypothetical protein [Myxococcus xanthus]|uniref:NHL repeat protein n=1 Tax=Myxococcus xanthus TaxID=34 RepID=A0A7Y4IGN2_MYXXA|nr:hypothetical protein [Myxococcus xanthus]NOJ85753.1 hypothetical protein [Myxococcus xanthus]
MARHVKNQHSLHQLVQQWFPQGNAAQNPRFAVVVDIGQGNCTALFDMEGRLLAYYDLGAGALVNQFTYPDPAPAFCVGPSTKVILSHWDEDHNASLDTIYVQHQAKLSGTPPTASLVVLAPAQRSPAPRGKTTGLLSKRSETSKSLETYLEDNAELHIWPDEDPNNLLPPTIPHAAHQNVRVIKVSGNNINNHALALRLKWHAANHFILLTGDAEYQPGSFTHGCDATCVGLVASHHGAEIEDTTSIPRPLPGARVLLAYSYGWGNSFSHPTDRGVEAYEGRGWHDDFRMDTGGSETAAKFAGPRGNVGLTFPADVALPGLAPAAAPDEIDEAAIALVATAAAELEVWHGNATPPMGEQIAVAAAFQAANEALIPHVAAALVTPATVVPPNPPLTTGGPVSLDVTAASGARAVASLLDTSLQGAQAHAAAAAGGNLQGLARLLTQATLRACARVAQELTLRVEERRRALEDPSTGARVHVSTRSRDPMQQAAAFARTRLTRDLVEESLPTDLLQQVVDAATQWDANAPPTVPALREALALAACEAAWAFIGVERGRSAPPPAAALHVAQQLTIRDDLKASIAAAVALAPAIPIGVYSVAPSALTENELAQMLPRVAVVAALVACSAGGAADVSAQLAVAAARVTLPAASGAPQIGCHRHPRTCGNGPTANSPCSLSIHYATKAFSSRIRTYAGDGTAGHTGEDVPATTGQLTQPAGMALGVRGDVFIADAGAHRIRQVNASGRMATFAGDGTAGDAGDATGARLTAELNGCQGIAVDEIGGAVYVADTLNHRIRKLELRTGLVSTVAGTGAAGHAGDGGTASSAQLQAPLDVFFAHERRCLYVADTGNHCIRMVDLRTGLISTVAGIPGNGGANGNNGPARQARLQGPSSVFVDTARSIYITDRGNHCVRIVEGDTIRNFAGTPGTAGHAGDVTTGTGADGTATLAQLNHPTHLTVGPDNVVYIADTGNHCIRAVTTETRSRRVPDPKKPSKTIKLDEEVDVIRTIAGTPGTSGHGGDGGPAAGAVFDAPTCVVHDDSSDSLYIADSGNHVVRVIDLSSNDIDHVAGTPTTSGDQGDTGPADAAELNSPSRLTVTKDGSLYVSDTDNHRIRMLELGGNIHAFAGSGTAGFSGDSTGQAANACLNGPRDVAFDDTRNVLYIADTLNHRIRQVDVATGLITTLAGTGMAGYNGEGEPATNHQLDTPSGLAINTDAGKLYVSDTGNHRVRVIDLASGAIDTVAGDGTKASTGDGAASTAASLDTPAGIALDYLTLKDLYVAETGSHCVRVIDLDSGDINTLVNTGKASGNTLNTAPDQTELDAPTSLALDEVGTLYIADTGNHRVLKVLLGPAQASLVTGTGIASSTGDGGAPAAATLNGPAGLAVDTAGRNLYVTEAAGFRCRKVVL